MVNSLTLTEAHVRHKAERLRNELKSLPQSGRGASLNDVLTFMLNRVDSTIDKAANRLRAHSDDVDQMGRLELMRPTLDIMHSAYAKYSDAIARDDIPVGLLHLVDEIMADVGLKNADPIICLNPNDMYSTESLEDKLLATPDFNDVAQYSGRPPIAINLPAIDPANALLSPILIHEAGHSSATDREGMLEALKRQIDKSAFNEILDAELEAANSNADDNGRSDFVDLCYRWWAEYLCDAVAIAVAGPSFLFALTAFSPPYDAEKISEHPFERDRIAFALRQLELAGWLPWLQSEVPDFLAWARAELEIAVTHTRGRIAFLREVSFRFRDEMIAVGRAAVSNELRYPDCSEAVRAAAELLSRRIPAVDHRGETFTAWEIVLAGWKVGLGEHLPHLEEGECRQAFAAEDEALEEVPGCEEEPRVAGPNETSLPHAVADWQLNRVMVKSIEFAAITRLWGKDD